MSINESLNSPDNAQNRPTEDAGTQGSAQTSGGESDSIIAPPEQPGGV